MSKYEEALEAKKQLDRVTTSFLETSEGPHWLEDRKRWILTFTICGLEKADRDAARTIRDAIVNDPDAIRELAESAAKKRVESLIADAREEIRFVLGED